VTGEQQTTFLLFAVFCRGLPRTSPHAPQRLPQEEEDSPPRSLWNSNEAHERVLGLYSRFVVYRKDLPFDPHTHSPYENTGQKKTIRRKTFLKEKKMAAYFAVVRFVLVNQYHEPPSPNSYRKHQDALGFFLLLFFFALHPFHSPFSLFLVHRSKK